jgi:hypothetical protein
MTKAKTKRVNLGKKGSFTSHPGRLHRELNVAQGTKIPMARKRAALNSKNPQTRRDARAAIGYAHMNHGGGRRRRSMDGGKHEPHHGAIGEH